MSSRGSSHEQDLSFHDRWSVDIALDDEPPWSSHQDVPSIRSGVAREVALPPPVRSSEVTRRTRPPTPPALRIAGTPRPRPVPPPTPTRRAPTGDAVVVRPRAQGTVPPPGHPYVIAMSADARRRRAQSTVEVAPLRFDTGVDAGGDTDGWFVGDRTADVQTMLQSELTRSAPFERARNRVMPWLIGLIAATCIAGLTFLVLRRDLRPAPAPPRPSPPASAPVSVPVPPVVHVAAPAPIPVAAPQPVVTEVATATPAVVEAPRVDTPKHRPRPHTVRRKESARRRVATASSSGTGTLMVSSKPPCDIVIDGVATVLTTPQRAIKVRAGKHTLTLYNLRLGVEVTVPFVIEPRKTTKVIRDLMRH